MGYDNYLQPGLVQLQPNLEEFMETDFHGKLYFIPYTDTSDNPTIFAARQTARLVILS